MGISEFQLLNLQQCRLNNFDEVVYVNNRNGWNIKFEVKRIEIYE